MIVSTFSVIFHHLLEKKVTVQVSMFPGIPKIIISGLATRVVRESRDRLISCLKSQKIKLKSYRTVINLMPTDLVKNDNHLELAMIAAVLAGYGLIMINQDDCYLGSVGLSGEVLSVPKIEALVLGAKQLKFKRVFLANDDLKKIDKICGIKFVGLNNIGQLISKNFREISATVNKHSFKPKKFKYTLANIVNNQAVVRVLQIAAVGNHHLLLTGPPGYGKTLTAHCLESLKPSLSYKDMLDVAKVYSLAGISKIIDLTPPFRKILPNISLSRFIGNPAQEKIGELKLANHGVLFMDEINLFKREVLDEVSYQLDDSCEDDEKESSFLLVATNNPCKCGYYGTQIKKCSCSPQQLTNYRQKLSGALLDRFDLFFEVNETLLKTHNNKIDSSLILTQASEAAKKLSQLTKNCREENINENLLILISNLSTQSKKTIDKARINLKLSNRALLKLIRVARTISFLDGGNTINDPHVIEALSYRRR